MNVGRLQTGRFWWGCCGRCAVWVAGAGPGGRRALEITRLCRVFGMARTVPEALEGIAR